MTYYNENNPYAAAWLRNLITDGLIPGGDVDERSIADVLPGDLGGYTQHHLFAGLGGWPYALRLAGWPDDRPILTGSCPCQPFSVAGKGLAGDDPRHLWPHMYRILRELRPPVVMGEQVAGTAGYKWLDGVLADLEAKGYSGRAVDIPAGSVNAPHIRNRIYWVADTASARGGTRLREAREVGHWHGPLGPGGGTLGVDDTAGARLTPASCGSVETVRDDAWLGESERRSGDGGLGGMDDPAQFGRGERQPEPELRSGWNPPGLTSCATGPLADTGSGLLSLPWWRPQRRDGPGPASEIPVGLGDAGRERLPVPKPEDLPGTRWREEGGAAPESGSASSRVEHADARGGTQGRGYGEGVGGAVEAGGDATRNIPAFTDAGASTRSLGDATGAGWSPDGGSGESRRSPDDASSASEDRGLDHTDRGRCEQPDRALLAGRTAAIPASVGHTDLSLAGDGDLQRSGQLGGLGGDPRSDPGFWSDWVLVGPDPSGKYRRVKPGVRLLAHGIPSRVAKLRAFGNAIVPQEAAEVIRAYMETAQ